MQPLKLYQKIYIYRKVSSKLKVIVWKYLNAALITDAPTHAESRIVDKLARCPCVKAEMRQIQLLNLLVVHNFV